MHQSLIRQASVLWNEAGKQVYFYHTGICRNSGWKELETASYFCKTKKPATEINVQQILVLHTKSAGFLPIFINVETFHIKPHYMRIFSIFYTIGEILTS